MDHDDFGHRGQGRRPYENGSPPVHQEDECKLGIIDDPLKEFEHVMREKDPDKWMTAVRKRLTAPRCILCTYIIYDDNAFSPHSMNFFYG